MMVERDDDCVRIVHQIRAVQGALHEINRLLLQHYLEVCVKQHLQKGKIDDVACENYIAEIVSLYQLLGISLPNRKELV